MGPNDELCQKRMEPNNNKITPTTQSENISKLGYATFSSDWSIILDQETRKVLKKELWEIKFNNNWAEVFSKQISAQCTLLEVKSQQNSNESAIPSLFPSIINISFPFLIIISLRDLNLVSIEPLAFLKMENLQQINLANNKITSLKPLNKQKWDDLSYLYLYENKMRGAEINRMKFSRNLHQLDFDRPAYNNFMRVINQIQVEDISKLIKIQSLTIKNLVLTRYLDQLAVIKRLEDRFPWTNFFTPDEFIMWS